MILSVFEIGGDQVEVIVRRNELMFRDVSTQMISTIEGLNISKAGVLTEHPDLKDNNEWKIIAIQRLKEHMKKINKELDKIYYIREELNKFGYKELYYIRAGFRPQKFKNE